jgi:hypothetical protein
LPGITRNPRPNRSFLLLNYYLGVPDPLVEPLLPGVMVGGVVVVLPEVLGEIVPGIVVLPPTEPPVVAPAPAPARRSRRHFSRSSPTMGRHLFSASTLTVPDALVSAPPLALVPPEPTVPPADAPPLTLEPGDAPVLPDVEPGEDCAKAADDRARSAAAVAAVIAFNIMWFISLKDW